MNRRSFTWIITAMALVLWLFFVYATFYWAQKPLLMQNALAMARGGRDLAVAVLILGVAAALGRRIFCLLDRDSPSAPDALLYQVGLGLGVLALGTLVLGLAGLLYRGLFWGLIVALFVLLFRDLRAIVQTFPHLWKSLRLPRWLVGYLAIVGFLALLVALTPPTDWDGLFYHLTGPKWHIARHQILPGYDVPHLNFPGLIEMLFTFSMLLSSDVTAKLLHLAYGLLLLGITFRMARRHVSPHSAPGAVLLVSSMPMLAVLAGWAYNDLALAFYQVAALSALMDWLAARQRRSLILSAVNCGLAMGIKYTSFVCPVVIVFVLIWLALRRRQKGWAGLRVVALFIVLALIVAAPWYLKNWAFTGNPFYPFVFGGQFWDDFRAGWYAQAGTGIGADWLKWLTLPWLATLGIHDMNYYDGRMGPLFLALLPVAILYVWRRWRGVAARPLTSMLPLAAFAVAHYGFWMVGVVASRSLWQSRLLLPAFVALSPILAFALDDLAAWDQPVFSPRRFVQMTVAIVLAFNLVGQTLDVLHLDPMPYLVGRETRPEFLRRRLGAYYQAMESINRDLPSDAKVLFLWEPRSYYCQRNCLPDSILDAFPHSVYQHSSAAAIARAWRQEGVTHVLLFRSGLDFVLSESPGAVDIAVLDELETHYLQKVFDVAGAYQGYALQPVPSVQRPFEINLKHIQGYF